MLLSLLLLASCTENTIKRTSHTDTFQQAPSNQVDILWVIDNSFSMENEQANVALGAADFMTALETTGMDVQLGVISTDVERSNANAGILLGSPPVLTPSVPDYVNQFKARVQMGTDGADKEKGLEAALTALTPPLSQTRNAGFLRDEASLAIILLSDENDCSDDGALGADAPGEECYTRSELLTPVSDFISGFRSLKDDPTKITVSGIVGPESLTNCSNTVPGWRYYQVITALSGARGNICETDYSQIMNSLQLVASGILTSFPLSYAAVEDTIEVTVTLEGATEGSLVPMSPTTGWTYDSDYAQVVFHGDAVPPRASTVEIHYDVAGPVPEPPDTGA